MDRLSFDHQRIAEGHVTKGILKRISFFIKVEDN